jgi:restriction endonuclease
MKFNFKIQGFQTEAAIKELGAVSLDVEMETGTGKTSIAKPCLS